MPMLSALALLVACSNEPKPAAPPPAEPAKVDEPKGPPKHAALFGKLPEKVDNPANEVTDAKVQLGRMLYYEQRVSKNHDLSCNSCHVLANFGVDNQARSPGHKAQLGDRNSPTVYNAALHTAQFWDGRAKDVEEQAMGPVTNPVEMAMPSADYVINVLRSIPGYEDAFKKAFPDDADPITFENFGRAIGAFERTLMTPGRFDKYVDGDASALSEAEQKGLDTFVTTGCTTCHNGAALGGTMYQKLGLVEPYPTEDLGRYKITNNEADKYVFKVPSLRNVTRTGPYFHDGSVANIHDAVKLMAKHQLGRELTDEQTAEIVTFLDALVGDVDEKAVAKPELPESGPNTPPPDPA